MKISTLLRTQYAFLGSAMLLSASAFAQQAPYWHGDPTPIEQQMLELINRARRNPAGEGIVLDSVNTSYSRDARTRKPAFFTNLRAEFASYPAVPPLAFNPHLIQAARAHSQDMVARSFFSHTNPESLDPSARATAAGYDLGVGENLDGGGAASGDEINASHFGFMVDYDNVDASHPLGHRLNVLSSGYSEIGVGVAGSRYAGRVTQDFGAPARTYILGVAYNDANRNGSYDPGEGLPGVTVRPSSGNWYAVTSSSGGYAIPVDAEETVTDIVNVPFPVQTASWSSIQAYDTAYRQQQAQAAPIQTVSLTWSGGGLTAPRVTHISQKRPVLRNFRLTGTDGWFYSRSMNTAESVKADLNSIRMAEAKDLNHDGNADLILQNTAGQAVAWHLNGAEGLSTSAWISSAGLGGWKVVGNVDMNSDGNADVIFQGPSGQIAAWYLNGIGGVAGTASLYGGSLGDWRLAGIGDINGDGKPDLVLQNTLGQVVVWYTDGRGTVIGFGWIYGSSLGDWKVVGVSDLNSDAIPDLVFQNTYGQVVVWFMNGRGGTSQSAWIYGGSLGDWKVAGFADTNGDDNSDILFQNEYGQIVTWHMDGRGTPSGSAWIHGGSLGDWRVR